MGLNDKDYMKEYKAEKQRERNRKINGIKNFKDKLLINNKTITKTNDQSKAINKSLNKEKHEKLKKEYIKQEKLKSIKRKHQQKKIYIKKMFNGFIFYPLFIAVIISYILYIK